MGENLIISILGEIRGFVWDRDIPSATCPEYIEHHRDCVEIMNFISAKMDMFRGKSNDEVARMLKCNGCEYFFKDSDAITEDCHWISTEDDEIRPCER